MGSMGRKVGAVREHSVTVKELIERLQGMPQDLPVYFMLRDHKRWIPIANSAAYAELPDGKVVWLDES